VVAESVVGALQHDDADACDGKLQTHRDATVEQPPHLVVIIPPFFARGYQDVHLLFDVKPAQQT
jgi:hypothetical protein